MRFELQDFRRFHKTNYAEIAPLTVMVGENSSGKTSLLAGIRYILQSMSPGVEASFNREPFFLGSYDQIAHYRGGRYGRSSNFALGLHINEQETDFFDPDDIFFFLGHRKKRENSYTSVRLVFGNEQSQPILNNVSFQNKYLSFVLDRKTLPEFRVINNESQQELLVKAGEPHILFSPASTIINRNSLSPFIQSVQNWAYSIQFSKTRKEKVSKLELEFQDLFNKSKAPISTFSQKIVYASAPFRTKPERTYSPIEASSSAEGSHIPILLSQTKAFEKVEWNRIKERIESFGTQSGMFKKIDIKRLGNSNSDPFQVIVTVSKDRSNIIDVGYGVSQILPLIVETLINDEAKIFVFQQPEVHLHPKAQAELGSYFVDFAINSKKYVLLETHSDYIIDRVKSDLMRRNLPLEEYLSVLFFDKDDIETNITRIKFDSDGNPIDPPQNYRGFFLSESIRNLGF
jgi:AAA15 family ATPase/GTPase